ncbi:MAG: oligoribonuclease [Gammaproteobacteria bacterium]
MNSFLTERATGQELNLVWIDLEMTGLNPLEDRILEIATAVTGPDLRIIGQGPELAIHQPEAVLSTMSPWSEKHHAASGLTERVRASRHTEASAELETLRFLEKHVPAGLSPMCGNSICQDRRFLARWMPHLEAFFHYRNLDVSTLKELARRWSPGVLAGYRKESQHTALADVLDSIAELDYYRKTLWRS